MQSLADSQKSQSGEGLADGGITRIVEASKGTLISKPRSMHYRQHLQQKESMIGKPVSTPLKRVYQNRSFNSEERFSHPSGRVYSNENLEYSDLNDPTELLPTSNNNTPKNSSPLEYSSSATLGIDVPSSVVDTLLIGQNKPNLRRNGTQANMGVTSETTSTLPRIGNSDPTVKEIIPHPNSLFTTARDSLPNLTTPAVVNRVSSLNYVDPDFNGGKIRFENFSEIIKQLDGIKSRFDERVNDLTLGITFFEKSLISEEEKCKDSLTKGFLAAVKSLAQEKIPEVYLRSVQKFGANSAMVSLHKSLLELKRATTTTNPQNYLSVKFDAEVSMEIEDVAKGTIDEIVNEFIGSLTTSNDRIAEGVKTMKTTNKQLESMLHDLKSENLFLLEKINQLEGVNLMQQEEIDNLKVDMSRQAAEMDIIQEQVNRRDRLLDEQRSNYLNELVQLQMKIYESNQTGKTFRSPSLVPSRKPSMVATDDRAPSPISKFSGTNTLDDGEGIQADTELSKMVKMHQKELERMIEERFESFKAQYLKEKRNVERNHFEEMERSEVEINKLKKTINNLERTLREMTLSQTANQSFEQEDTIDSNIDDHVVSENEEECTDDDED